MRNHRHIFFITLTILFVVFMNLFLSQQSLAVSGFGGQIPKEGGPTGLSVQPCTNGLLLTIGPPRGGLFLLPPTAKIYARYGIMPTVWTVGMFTPGGVCNIGLLQIPATGTIINIGVSFPSASR